MISRRGFTLIELIVVVGILALLLAITIVAINPARQLSQSNNTKRRSDVDQILNAINMYQSSNKGQLPSGISTTVQVISKTGSDLCGSLVPTYIAAFPVDPSINNGAAITDCSATYNSAYTIIRSATDSRVTVAAPNAEVNQTIDVTR